MFERFTDRARRAVVLAQEESRLLNHNYIGTEHVLLGLLAEDEGLAAVALRSQKIELEPARAEVLKRIGEGGSSPSGHIPFTPRAKKVLELALREALNLGHRYLGTEHILLGLIREGEGVACQVVVRLGGDLPKLREKVLELLRGGASDEGQRSAGAALAEAQLSSTLMRSSPIGGAFTGWTPLASAGVGGVTSVAAELGHDRIGTEHILLWLLRLSNGGAAQALRDHGVDVDGLKVRVEQQLDQAGGSTDP